MSEHVERRVSWQRVGYGLRYVLAFTAGIAVAVVGDVISFSNLRKFASEHTFPIDWGLPVVLDAGIPAFLLLDSMRPSKFFRGCAWVLSAITVVANVAVTPDSSWISRGLHGLAPAVSILWYEALRHLHDDDKKMDKVRWVRYLVSPVRTVRLRVRMIRWEVTSYTEALRLESAILLARAVLVSEYGQKDWRGTRKLVPVILRHQLDTGQLPLELFFSPDWTVEVRSWVRTTLDELGSARPSVLTEAERSEPDPSQFPAAAPRDPWELIWVLRDRLVPEGITPDVFVRAYAVARHHFDQFNRHITVDTMRDALGIRKDRAGVLAKLMRTAYETDPVLMLQEQDPNGHTAAAMEEPDEAAGEPYGLNGPYGDPLVRPGGA